MENELKAAQARIDELEAWKTEEMRVIGPLMYYAHEMCTGPLGSSVTDWLIADHKSLRAELAALKAQDPVAQKPSDSLIEQALMNFGGKWDGDRWTIEDADLHPFVHSFAAPVVSAEQQGVAIQRTLNGWGIVRQSDKAISIVDGSTYVTFSYDESDRRMPWLVEFLAAMLAAAPAPSTTEGQGDE